MDSYELQEVMLSFQLANQMPIYLLSITFDVYFFFFSPVSSLGFFVGEKKSALSRTEEATC